MAHPCTLSWGGWRYCQSVEEGGAVTGVVGAFSTFAALEPALKAGSIGDIALLLGLGDALVGVWQKIATGPDTIRLISPLRLDKINPLAPSLAIGTDITAVRGSNPSWVSSPTGLLLAQNSHVVIDAAGAWDVAASVLVARGQARQSGSAVGAYFGGGNAASTKTQGWASVIGWSGARWARYLGDGEAAINAALTLVGAATAILQESAVSASYAVYSLYGWLLQSSNSGSTTHEAFHNVHSTTLPYASVVGPANVGQRLSGYTQQDATDRQLMLVSDNGGAGSLDWLVQEVEQVTARERGV